MKTSLEKQLAIYQHVLDAAPDIIHIISPDMRIILRNQRSREWFPSIETGGKCFRWLHDTDKPCVHCSVQRVFKDGKRHEHESIIHMHNPDREIIFHSTASPVYDEDGQLLGALEILRDITERKNMERALEKTAEHLRTANRLKVLLMRMLRHDLGTPVGAILNTAEFLLEEPDDLGDLLDDIEDIHQCSSHILHLIRDVDVLSEVLMTSTLVLGEVDLTQILTDLAEELEPVMKQAGITLTAKIAEGMVIKGLPILKTVFENILVNGIKYASEGGLLKLVAASAEDRVIVEIIDFGPGITDENKEIIFQKFERVATDIPGTGLGLAIAEQTVALHHGDISVKDNPAGGAVFEIHLPRESQKTKDARQQKCSVTEKLLS
jgi:PAS domain S-box-containing protein